MWYVRPSPVSLLRAMALSVIHLQPLRLVLLDALMSDYTSLVDTYLSVFQEEPVDIQTGSQVVNTSKYIRNLTNFSNVLIHYPCLVLSALHE